MKKNIWYCIRKKMTPRKINIPTALIDLIISYLDEGELAIKHFYPWATDITKFTTRDDNLCVISNEFEVFVLTKSSVINENISYFATVSYYLPYSKIEMKQNYFFRYYQNQQTLDVYEELDEYYLNINPMLWFKPKIDEIKSEIYDVLFDL